MVALPYVVESCMNVNARNTKAGSLECRPMKPHVEKPHPLPPHVVPTLPMPHNTSHMQLYALVCPKGSFVCI